MNENLADEIRQQIEKCKDLKLDIGEINNHLSALEGLVRNDIEGRKNEAYQKGFEDGKAVNDKGCEGCMYNDGTKEHSPCDICCNAYLNRWTAKPQEDDDIKVGDEVRDDDGETYIITCLNDDGTFDALYPDGTAFSRADMSIIYEKTGRHFDIHSILEAMKHD